MTASQPLYTSSQLLDFLDQQHISYTLHPHPPVYTSEEADLYTASLEGFRAKNLFLSNANQSHFYLYVCYESLRTNLKQLGKLLGDTRLHFADEDALLEKLGITRGALSLFALINDPRAEVTLILEKAAANAEAILLHPLVNTATLIISHQGLQTFLTQLNRNAFVVDAAAEPYRLLN